MHQESDTKNNGYTNSKKKLNYLDIVIFQSSHNIIQEPFVILTDNLNKGVSRTERIIHRNGNIM